MQDTNQNNYKLTAEQIKKIEETIDGAIMCVEASVIVKDEVKKKYIESFEMVRQDKSTANLEVLDILLEYLETVEKAVSEAAKAQLEILQSQNDQVIETQIQ